MDTEPKLKKKLSVGSLNVRGIRSKAEQKTLVKDALTYNLDIITLAETHIGDQHFLEELKEQNKDGSIKEYVIFSTSKENSHLHGTGLLVKKNLKPVFERINNRICKAVIKLRDHRATIISAYAHTLKVSEGNPELRGELYETIESIIDKTPKRDAIILAGDFNAKTGSGWNEFRENIGKYGKGLMNSSGRRLLEMCKKK